MRKAKKPITNKIVVSNPDKHFSRIMSVEQILSAFDISFKHLANCVRHNWDISGYHFETEGGES